MQVTYKHPPLKKWEKGKNKQTRKKGFPYDIFDTGQVFRDEVIYELESLLIFDTEEIPPYETISVYIRLVLGLQQCGNTKINKFKYLLDHI